MITVALEKRLDEELRKVVTRTHEDGTPAHILLTVFERTGLNHLE